MSGVDAVVVGSGPNGLAAAVTLARAGLSVRVYETAGTIGGGTRTMELTLPGFHHDVCSAVHPQAFASPFFAEFELEKRVRFVVPDLSYAHPLGDGRTGLAYRDLERTVRGLGVDGRAWRRLVGPLVQRLPGVVDVTGNPLLRMPSDPIAALGFGIRALRHGARATGGLGAGFTGEVAAAMLTGVAAHSGARLPSVSAAGAGLLLAAHAHARGWPIPVGGSQAIADALADDLRAHGGEIVTGVRVRSLEEVEPARAVLLDTSPHELVRIVGPRMPAGYRRAIERFRYRSAIAKVDFALSAPVPWREEALADAATVHLGGTREQIETAERDVAAGRHAEHPFMIVSQPSVVDPSRAPEGRHVLWAYAHVPLGSTLDPTGAVVAEVERHAPGFRDTILASAARSAREVGRHNANDVGGDISGGAMMFAQLIRRPVVSRSPWRTPIRGVFLCSASTPPGPSVHGMCGWFAACAALADVFGVTASPSLACDGRG